jgi:hypothetical protein
MKFLRHLFKTFDSYHGVMTANSQLRLKQKKYNSTNVYLVAKLIGKGKVFIVGTHTLPVFNLYYLLFIGMNKKSCVHNSGLRNTSAFS